MDIEEIHKLKTYLVDQYYAKLRTEQTTDQHYKDDVFSVPQIKAPAKLSRTGRGARIVDSPAEHIITSNPQVFRHSKKESYKEADRRILEMLNQKWMPLIRQMNPNPFKEAVKNCLLRGENWVQVTHVEGWTTGDSGLPIGFILPDPMVIYGDFGKSGLGSPIPERVIVFYKRLPWLVMKKWPDWKDPKGTLSLGGEAEWLEGWDKDTRYFEADNKPVLGPQKNIYRFVPFVHTLSGFGKSSPSGEPADLIVGRLRHIRDLLIRECAITSSLDSILYLMGQPQIDFEVSDPNITPSDDLIKNYKVGLGVGNIIPYGVKRSEVRQAELTDDMFAYLGSIRAEIEREAPSVMAGLPVGASGRQQDVVAESAMKRYETIVENVENQFSIAFGMALRIIDTIPQMYPAELHKGDLHNNYEVEVKLKAKDPIEQDRMATLGSRLYAQGEIDLRTNLVQYKGYTQDEAEGIIVDILVDQISIHNPDVAEVMGMVFGEESGMGKYLEMARMRRAEMEKQQRGLMEAPGASEQQQRVGEIESPLSRETIDRALTQRGARRPPAPYTRGS